VRVARRAAGIIGIVSVVVLFFASFLTSLPHAPDVGASGAAYASWLAENPPGAKFWAGAYLEVLALIALIFFFAAFWNVLRQGAGEWQWLADAAFACGVVTSAVKLASGPIAMVVYDRAPHGLSGDVNAALIESNDWSFLLTWAIDGAFLLAAGGVILATRVLPRWLGWSGAVAGVVSLLAILAGKNTPPVVVLFFLWIVATGVVLLRPRNRAVA
jgi:hypothetical protein